MKIKREINGIELSFEVTDEEMIQTILSKSKLLRIEFFRKLVNTEIGEIFPFNLIHSSTKFNKSKNN
jgi:hypothetical protein